MIDLMTIVNADDVKIGEITKGGFVVAFCDDCTEARYGSDERQPDMGVFHIIFEHSVLNVIADSGEGWDHVSVSVNEENRCPTWEEMEAVKRAFFHHHECAMQLHVPVADHISIHPYVLHIWRPHDVAIPVPPKSRL